MATSIIKVYNASYGKWAKGARVSLSFDASLGGFSKEVYTDEQGMAVIEHSSTGMATVYVNGRTNGRIRTPGSYTAQIS